MNNRQVIRNVTGVLKNKKRNDKEGTIDAVLQTIRDKKHAEEQKKIYMALHPPVIIPRYEPEFSRLSATNQGAVKNPFTVIKKDSYISKLMTTIENKKKDKTGTFQSFVFGNWPEPSANQIIRGTRTMNDFSDIALLEELSNVENGWSIFMELYDKKIVDTMDMCVVRECVWQAKRKRDWLLTDIERIALKKERDNEERERAAMYEEEQHRRKVDAVFQEFIHNRIEEQAREIMSDPLLCDLWAIVHIPGSWSNYLYGDCDCDCDCGNSTITDMSTFTDAR